MDTPSLFPDLPPSPSPRLKWMEQHRLIEIEDEDIDGHPIWRVGPAEYAIRSDPEGEILFIDNSGEGPTLRDAEIDYCERFGIKHYSLWNSNST